VTVGRLAPVVIVTSSMNQIVLASPVWLQRISCVPSLLKSPVPTRIQAVEREGRDAEDAVDSYRYGRVNP
jgi:hypothetical protein